MATWEVSGHETDDVRWPWKVKVVTPVWLVSHYLENGWRMEIEALLQTIANRYVMAYGEWNRHVLDYVTCLVLTFGTDYILSRHFQNR